MNAKILSLLKELEESKEHPSDIGLWNVSWGVGEFLAEKVSEHKPKVIVEVGTSNGFSGIWMASAAAEYGGELYTIESSPKRIPLAKESFKKSGLTNIHFIEGHAPEKFIEIPDTVDMIFLDATKKQYLQFYEGLKEKFGNKVLLLADNVLSHPEPVKDYLDTVRKNHESTCLDIGTGLEMTWIDNI